MCKVSGFAHSRITSTLMEDYLNIEYYMITTRINTINFSEVSLKLAI